MSKHTAKYIDVFYRENERTLERLWEYRGYSISKKCRNNYWEVTGHNKTLSFRTKRDAKAAIDNIID